MQCSSPINGNHKKCCRRREIHVYYILKIWPGCPSCSKVGSVNDWTNLYPVDNTLYLVFLILIHWIVIYPVNNKIQLLNYHGQVDRTLTAGQYEGLSCGCECCSTSLTYLSACPFWTHSSRWCRTAPPVPRNNDKLISVMVVILKHFTSLCNYHGVSIVSHVLPGKVSMNNISHRCQTVSISVNRCFCKL